MRRKKNEQMWLGAPSPLSGTSQISISQASQGQRHHAPCTMHHVWLRDNTPTIPQVIRLNYLPFHGTSVPWGREIKGSGSKAKQVIIENESSRRYRGDMARVIVRFTCLLESTERNADCARNRRCNHPASGHCHCPSWQGSRADAIGWLQGCQGLPDYSDLI